MTESIEAIYKILFLVFSVMWIGNILLFRSERQIIINPILILISSLLVFLPNTSTLYVAYYLIVVWGIIITRRKTDLF